MWFVLRRSVSGTFAAQCCRQVIVVPRACEGKQRVQACYRFCSKPDSARVFVRVSYVTYCSEPFVCGASVAHLHRARFAHIPQHCQRSVGERLKPPLYKRSLAVGDRLKSLCKRSLAARTATKRHRRDTQQKRCATPRSRWPQPHWASPCSAC